MSSSFFEKKRRARKLLHRELSRPAFYFPDPDDPETYEEITVRVHYKFDALGEMKGTSFEYAEKQAVVPKLVFNNEEITPQNHAVVTLMQYEAYQVDNVLPPDDFTTTAEAPRMPRNVSQQYPWPGME